MSTLVDNISVDTFTVFLVINVENTPDTLTAQRGNGQVAECEPRVTHLLPGERELLAECHRHGAYLTLRGAVLLVSELASSWCEPECEHVITYCPACLRDAAECNAHAGVLPLGARSAR